MSTNPSSGINQVGITGFGTHFPKQIKHNRDLTARGLQIPDGWLERAGMVRRRWAAEGENALDLACEAARKAIQHAGIPSEDIDLLIMASSSFCQDQVCPSGVALLQQRLRIPNAMSMFVVETCCGSLMAMETGANAIAAGQARHALIVSSETFSKYFNPDNEMACLLGLTLGDGAGAVLLSAASESGRLGSYFMTNADLQTGLGLMARAPQPAASFAGGLRIDGTGAGPSYKGKSLSLEGAVLAVNLNTTKSVVDAMQRVLAKCQMHREDLDFFVLHQPNRFILNSWKQQAGISDEETIDTLADYGNLSGVSVLANMEAAYRANRLRPGAHILLASIGAGSTWGAMIWRWTLPPPDERAHG